MQSSVLQALEFDRIREALAREILTPLGRTCALTLDPSTGPAEVRDLLNATSEAVELLGAGASLELAAAEGLGEVLDVLQAAGQPLEPLGLLALASFVESVDRVSQEVRHARATAPLLARVADQAASFGPEAGQTRRSISPAGDVLDDASAALRSIRDSLRKQRATLRATLEKLTRGRDTAKYLQDQIVADRGGRYVLVVRAEHQGAIPGIVHGSSASGASLYLEPLATVQTNNDIVSLVEREKAEVFRILLALTDAYRRRADELNATVDAAAELDLARAKARLAARMQASAPELADDGRVELRAARHPLLGKAVPNDIVIVPPDRALIISGPNTGGKTVALKAAGLLALMAQAGLHVPAAPGSVLTPFRSIFANIGDEQSIAASLSTFSARIAHIVEMERALALPALVLLDEVGGGTDPTEGGALGTAVIDHFRHRGATVIATTHDDTLKSFAATTDGVAAAAMGFVPETYAPTYTLIYGAPGRSLALEIAERLGMPASVIASARSRRSDRESQLAAHLARVDRELAALEQERGRLMQERRELDREREALVSRESKVTEREAVARRRLDDRVNERLREARAAIDAVVSQVKTRADALSRRGERDPVSTGELGRLRTDARTALDGIADAAGQPRRAETLDVPLTGPPAQGDEVWVPAFAAPAVITHVSGKHAEVEIRGKRMKLEWRDLRQGRAAESPREPAVKGRVTAPAQAAAGLTAGVRELMVIGKTVDEATDAAEKFLDAALLADARRLRIVHGHGTGRLRDAMNRFFRDHPLVATVEPAPDNEGGAGATIVELREE